MTRGWGLTASLVVILVASSLAVRGSGGEAEGLGVPGLLFPAVEAPAEAGADAAARAERRVRAFVAGRGGADSLVLGQAEVSAVVRERLSGRLPRGVSGLRVELRGPTAAVSASLRFDSLRVGGPAARRLGRILGDSARVEVEVEPSVVDPGRGRVVLRGLRAAGLPLPSALIRVVLDRFGVETEARDGDPSLSVPLPAAVASVAVGDGRVVLRRSGGE